MPREIKRKGEGDARNIVAVEDLSVGYGDVNILENVNFAIREGEVVAFLGPSGCGKTTLLKAMVGLLPPREGKIRIMGEEIGRGGVQALPKEVRMRLGVLFQSGALISSINLAENVALPIEEFTDLPGDLREEVVRMKFDLVRLGPVGEKMPSELSDGMAKRASLARAIALDPRVLFCDEPTAGLDPATAVEIDRLLLELRKRLGITIVIITHELPTVENIADRCFMLDREARGIIAEGSLEEIRKQDDPRIRSFFQRRIGSEGTATL